MTTNMQIEDRIAEKLKSEEFGKWFGDEELHDLIKRGIDIAFFKDRTNPNGYSPSRLPPIIVEVATASLKEIIATETRKIIQKRIEDEPELLAAILAKVAEKTMGDLAIKSVIDGAFESSRWQIEENIRKALGSR